PPGKFCCDLNLPINHDEAVRIEFASPGVESGDALAAIKHVVLKVHCDCGARGVFDEQISSKRHVPIRECVAAGLNARRGAFELDINVIGQRAEAGEVCGG